ncbi:MAG: nuclear transport factor 2 family protein [Deltaproteobacteria bacterium]|nr:nuclear transport factor 2 family protein [Deltaproteobacteria bacterium]MCW5804896.1 nuclear transport factor 2 family protein [Deltaproteobacteria bacterium]
MHPNARTIETFYEAFGRRDAAGMIACYHADVWFSDPAFGDLRGPRAGAMWKMLCERATSLEIVASGISADDAVGRAHWEAKYEFSATGRNVHNKIDAAFEFRDGKIIRHADTFDLWRWAGMALGPKGKLLGWLPPVKAAIRKQARKGLAQYEASAGGASS